MPLPLPTAHYMALAPLDVWVRLLFRPLARIGPKYWLRLFALLLSSTAATVVTLPERVGFWLWNKVFPVRREKLPGPVFVLGYYRSGTTHLHYLLECDPQMYTPNWVQMLAPQGFVGSWTFLRLFLIPFMSGQRPMDAMDVGPEFAAEDHFGVNNWSLTSTLPGKSVLPQAAAFYGRFNTLVGVTREERTRWNACQWGLIAKLSLLAGRRRLLLKSPSHTAHVPALLELLAGVPDAKFIHITRTPDKVLRSNVWMHKVFQRIWNLQDATPQTELEEQLAAEYLETEQSYLAARKLIPPGALAEMRLQDLHADPVHEMQRVYRELGLEWTPEFERNMLAYLDATRDFRPATHEEWTAEQQARLGPLLAPLEAAFDHRTPALPKNPPPRAPLDESWFARRRGNVAVAATLCAALAVGLVWWGLVRAFPQSYGAFDRLIWPTGLAAGFAACRTAGKGTTWLGALAAGAALAVLATVSTINVLQFHSEVHSVWQALATAAIEASASFHTVFWAVLGLVSAYRLGSRTA